MLTGLREAQETVKRKSEQIKHVNGEIDKINRGETDIDEDVIGENLHKYVRDSGMLTYANKK